MGKKGDDKTTTPGEDLAKKLGAVSGGVAALTDEAAAEHAVRTADQLEDDYRKEKEAQLRRRRLFWKVLTVVLPVLVLAMLVLSMLVLNAAHSRFGLWAVGLVAFTIVVIAFGVARMEAQRAETHLEDLRFEALVTPGLDYDAKRAERSFRINENRLRQYYDLNIHQNRWVFLLGLACVVAGLIFAFYALYAVQRKSSEDIKILVGVLGGIGAVLSNFVAVMLIHMHSSAAKVLAQFHYRLVRTHQLLLGHFIVTRIADKDLQRKTMAALSLALVDGHGSEAVDGRSTVGPVQK